jgi:mutator protein MutT
MPHGVKPSKKRLKCMRAARVAALVVKDGQILAVRHAHPDPDKEYWVLPGGGLEPGETPQECARREMQEEARVTVNVLRLAYVLDQEFQGGRQLELYFLCSLENEDLRMSAELVEKPGEFQNEFVWVTPEELARQRFFPEALKDRLIQDAPGGFASDNVYLEARTIR